MAHIFVHLVRKQNLLTKTQTWCPERVIWRLTYKYPEAGVQDGTRNSKVLTALRTRQVHQHTCLHTDDKSWAELEIHVTDNILQKLLSSWQVMPPPLNTRGTLVLAHLTRPAFQWLTVRPNSYRLLYFRRTDMLENYRTWNSHIFPPIPH